MAFMVHDNHFTLLFCLLHTFDSDILQVYVLSDGCHEHRTTMTTIYSKLKDHEIFIFNLSQFSRWLFFCDFMDQFASNLSHCSYSVTSIVYVHPWHEPAHADVVAYCPLACWWCQQAKSPILPSEHLPTPADFEEWLLCPWWLSLGHP